MLCRVDVLAVDHWDLSAWTTRCPTAALLSVFDDVAADAPSKGDSAALARAATPVGGDTASACAPHKPSAGALEDAPRNTSASRECTVYHGLKNEVLCIPCCARCVQSFRGRRWYTFMSFSMQTKGLEGGAYNPMVKHSQAQSAKKYVA